MARWHRSVRRWDSKLRVVSSQNTAAGVELPQPIREPVKNDQWQRDRFTMLTSVPWDTRGSR